MTKIAEPFPDWETNPRRFVAFDETGRDTGDWVDPVIGFTEYDDIWAIESLEAVYTVARMPGWTYQMQSMGEWA